MAPRFPTPSWRMAALLGLALASACAPSPPPAHHGPIVVEMPPGRPPQTGHAVGAWVPSRTDGHPTHAAPVYETASGCTGFNAAYAMTAEVAHRRCEDMYVAGQVSTYRTPVYHDALGRAHAPNPQGMWTRSVPHDRYVIGDQPHR